MVYKIIGWFWIISGVYFALRPKSLVRRLQRQGKWKLRKLLFLAAMIWGSPFVALAWKQEGLMWRVALIAGTLVLFKIVFRLTSKISEKLILWGNEKSPYIFCMYAIIQIILGFTLTQVAEKT